MVPLFQMRSGSRVNGSDWGCELGRYRRMKRMSTAESKVWIQKSEVQGGSNALSDPHQDSDRCLTRSRLHRSTIEPYLKPVVRGTAQLLVRFEINDGPSITFSEGRDRRSPRLTNRQALET